MSRLDRVSELIRKELARIIRVRCPDLGFISLTTITLSKDLSYAKIFYSQIGSDDEKEKTFRKLKQSAKFLKGEVGKQVRLKTIPNLRFIYDPSLERGARITEKLKAISIDES